MQKIHRDILRYMAGNCGETTVLDAQRRFHPITSIDRRMRELFEVIDVKKTWHIASNKSRYYVFSLTKLGWKQAKKILLT